MEESDYSNDSDSIHFIHNYHPPHTRAESINPQPSGIISEKTPDASLSVQQQKKTITGKVVDEAGIPVIGATVIEAGTKNGTITDADWNFWLEVPDNAVILVTCIGFSDTNIPAGNKTRLAIVLKEDRQHLEEVVVTAFATQKKVNVTGAITAVTGDEILQAPVANISSALVGITPGLSAVSTSGEPGQDAADIAIRGISSYSGNTAPLIVIDGIEQPANQAMSIMNSLNPNDILGISVLKDASSTAVYG
ncbi:MAG: TonB-dependent receptor plug domain-containing protein, partial [Bacteroidales bacterium]|nr:TonB-dependent receptor plug domain-containing protein [Bacteroidales bacterium]